MFYRVRVVRVNPRLRKGLIAGSLLVLLAGAYVLGLVAFNTQRDNGRKHFDIDSGRKAEEALELGDAHDWHDPSFEPWIHRD